MFNGKQWLLIDAANHAGKDKSVWDVRLDFGREVLEEIKQMTSSDEIADMEALANADEPELFAASCLAIWDTLQGKETGYSVELDACNSGAQLQSLLTRDYVGMQNTGCIDTGGRPDLYNLIKENLGLEMERVTIKEAVIPHMYNSVSAPLKILGEEAYGEFIKACNLVMPGAEWCKSTLNEVYDDEAEYHQFYSLNSSVIHVKSTTHVKLVGKFMEHAYTYLYKKEGPQAGGKYLPSAVIHGVDAAVLQEMDARCNHSKAQLERVLAAIEHHRTNGSKVSNLTLRTMAKNAVRWNFFSIHGIDHMVTNELASIPEEYLNQIYNMVKELLGKPSFVTKDIHDGFSCHPNYVSVMKQHYNDILAELYVSSYLTDTIYDLGGDDYGPHMAEPLPEILDQIRNNQYALC